MTRFFDRVIRRFRPSKPSAAPILDKAVENEKARVVFCAFGNRSFSGAGKVTPKRFFPVFCSTLNATGFSTFFVSTPRELAAVAREDSCLVHIYNEEIVENAKIFRHAVQEAMGAMHRGVVFNDIALGNLISRKDLTNIHLAQAGIAVPRQLQSADEAARVFSNAVSSSGAVVSEEFEPSRYNTEFIDTRVAYKGREYFTTVRLLCVGGTLLHCNIGARRATESPAVHGADIPLDPDLVEYLYGHLVERRLEALIDLAARLGRALGPGFFAHDLVICSKTGVPYVCEVGVKFHAKAYETRLLPIADRLPSQRRIFDGTYEIESAQAFLKEYARQAEALRA